MRLSRYFLPVLKETPREAQIVSHRLMLRAGLIRKLAAGLYTWLPLGYRVLRKVEQALERIDDGSYGYCEDTGEPIGVARLKARPIATLTIDAQERREMTHRPGLETRW